MKGLTYLIEAMKDSDWPEVLQIYLDGLATGIASFETAAPGWDEWNAARLPHSRLVARDERVLGWAALSQVSKRQCYVGVAEFSIYVSPAVFGRGIGTSLLRALIDTSERNGIWTLQGVTHAVNESSIKLQLAAGFREVGRRERIAKRDGKWHDTIMLERRSAIVGVD